MHTYHSALPFTPHDTRLYRLYEQETSHSITVLQGLRPTWTSCLATLSLFEFGDTILSISLDAMVLAVGQDRKIMILDARTTASQCQISLTDKIACLAFSPSERTLATVTSKTLELWNTTTGINQHTQTLSGRHFYEVAFSWQGQYLLLSVDRGLHLHRGTDAGELSVLSTDWRHQTITFASNDNQVITGSKEGYIHFFTLSGNQLNEMRESRIFNETRVERLVLRQDGKRLASGGKDGRIRIYDLPSRSRIATLRRPEGWSRILAMAYHPTEEELAVCQDRDVVLWRQKETPSDWMPSIHSNDISLILGVAYCQNGTRMYTNTFNGDIKLWATTVTRVQEPPKHASHVQCYAFNQPTSLLATGSNDKTIILWNFTTGDYRKTIDDHMASVKSLIFSDDGVLLASGDGNSITIVWDVASSSRLHQFERHDSFNYVVAFSEDNAHLTTRTYEEYFVWELTSGMLLEQRDREGSIVEDYQLTPHFLIYSDGWRTMASVSEGKKGKKCKYGLYRLPGESEIDKFRQNPIFGDRAALLCEDGRVLILDISRVMDVHMDPARQIELSDADP